MDRVNDSVITAAACQVFSFGCVTQGRDELGLRLLADGRRMAERLRLFGVSRDEPLTASLRDASPEVLKATAHVAWGMHNWLT